MPTYDIYSKRDQIDKEPDIYLYDELPDKLRKQVHHIIKEAIGKSKFSYSTNRVENIYSTIRRVLLKEYGKFYLAISGADSERDVLDFFLTTKSTHEALDVIELCFRFINSHIIKSPAYKNEVEVLLVADDAIAELNARFKENGIGYVFDSDRIIRIDATLTHTEIVKPTLQLLSNPIFANANEEYLKAHDHYRHGRNKEALTEALKAFESTIKIILNSKGWAFDEKDTASKLIQKCLDNGLVPAYLQNQFTSLRTVLETGIPTIRNKVGGHGQGHEKKEAPDELVRYALNLTGSNIIFLVELSGLK